MYMINLMIIYDVENTFSMKNYKSSRKLRVGMNWSTTTTALPPIMVSVPIMVTPSRSNKSKCHGEENMK